MPDEKTLLIRLFSLQKSFTNLALRGKIKAVRMHRKNRARSLLKANGRL
jgi:hypothetical protein